MLSPPPPAVISFLPWGLSRAPGSFLLLPRGPPRNRLDVPPGGQNLLCLLADVRAFSVPLLLRPQGREKPVSCWFLLGPHRKPGTILNGT